MLPAGLRDHIRALGPLTSTRLLRMITGAERTPDKRQYSDREILYLLVGGEGAILDQRELVEALQAERAARLAAERALSAERAARTVAEEELGAALGRLQAVLTGPQVPREGPAALPAQEEAEEAPGGPVVVAGPGPELPRLSEEGSAGPEVEITGQDMAWFRAGESLALVEEAGGLRFDGPLSIEGISAIEEVEEGRRRR